MCNIKNTTLRLNFTYSGCNNRGIWQHNTVITMAAQEILWKQQNKRLSSFTECFKSTLVLLFFPLLYVDRAYAPIFVICRVAKYLSITVPKEEACSEKAGEASAAGTYCVSDLPLQMHIWTAQIFFPWNHPQSNVEVDTPVGENKRLKLVIETWEITSSTYTFGID